MTSKNFYLTTTLPYVNADPHIGFALELVQSDVIVRYKRKTGHEVFFNTGTDEHGQKIFTAAEKKGEDVQKYVDHYAGEFKKLSELLNISYDNFIRTTDASHIKAAQEIWKRCVANNDIDKRSYEGKYCVGCEAYKTDKDLVDGKCPIHPNLEITILKEENYFFKFSKYQDKLMDYLSKPGVILPEWRREEAMNFVKGGLEDFSISREKKKLTWGIPVPGDEDQVMYVWFDALTNYISTLGWPDGENFKKYWEEGDVVQTAGKDQVRFQSIMWQAMLFSAGVKNTDKVIYHGFVMGEWGMKMSKSLGNVVNPIEIVNEYGTDALRYFLIREISQFEDSPFTIDRFKEAYNSGLANGLGNLTSRIMKMAETNLEKPVDVLNLGFNNKFIDYIENYNLQKACEYVWMEIGLNDLAIQEQQPFKLVKTNPEKGRELIEKLVQNLYNIASMLEIFLPETAKKIQECIKINKSPEKPLFLRRE